MNQYPEHIQFRALPGTSFALDSLAKTEGKRVGEIIRELVAERLRKHSAPAASSIEGAV